jgi:hypothetical protein
MGQVTEVMTETVTIGTRDGWNTRLREKGYELRGHHLVRAKLKEQG